jgi:hypothetical protein
VVADRVGAEVTLGAVRPDETAAASIGTRFWSSPNPPSNATAVITAEVVAAVNRP